MENNKSLHWYVGMSYNIQLELAQHSRSSRIKSPLKSDRDICQLHGQCSIANWLPSGKRLHNYGKIHHFYGKIHYNWPFSIAILTSPKGNSDASGGKIPGNLDHPFHPLVDHDLTPFELANSPKHVEIYPNYIKLLKLVGS